ncbi:hypothetical protein [Lacrimispora sp.]|jgi:N-acetylmuramoyl-L-alanine amidase|uniref:hypothetical protein n=1 Tax=Lacrimispora sp. TaxID=2719234 RepID=UPI00289EB64C|nr:hypothetical protein [Lacrimispora sp.]
MCKRKHPSANLTDVFKKGEVIRIIKKTTYYKSCWQIINGHYFNPDGYEVTDWQMIDGQDYYFEPRAGHELECALYVSDRQGAQGLREF